MKSVADLVAKARAAGVRNRLQAADLTALGTTGAQAQQLMAAEMVRWEPLVRGLGLKAN